MSDVDTEPERTKYSLKIVNPQKNDYKVVKIGKKVCKDINDLKELILSNFPETVDAPDDQDMEFRFIEPGHGLRGKREWLSSSDDVTEMFEQHKDKKEIMLWCYSYNKTKSKRSRSRSPVPHSTRYDSHLKKVSEVDQIFQKLDEKHKGEYSPEQMRAWSHLIQMGKHTSYEDPPDKPFFRGRNRNKPSTPDAKTKEKRTSTACISPGRRVGIHSEYNDQLSKRHTLLESDAITKEQYDGLQGTVLTDLKQL